MLETKQVLWTGGWDSTFRVLSLASAKNCLIQPHYIVNPERLSRSQEQEVVDMIRSAANDRWGNRILYPNVTHLQEIEISERARRQHKELVEQFGIGPQYLWLSEYARQVGIGKLELCIHVDDRAYGVVGMVMSVENRDFRAATLEPDDPRNLILTAFELPLLEISKVEMGKVAHANQFVDLMDMTWFCQIPTRSGEPCGFCNPCRATIDEGLKHRVPLGRRIRLGVYRRAVVRVPSYRVRKYVLELLRH